MDFQGGPWPFCSSSFSNFSLWLLSNVPKECKKEIMNHILRLGKGSRKQTCGNMKILPWAARQWVPIVYHPLLSPELHNQEWLCLVSYLLTIAASLRASKCGNTIVRKWNVCVKILHGIILLKTVFKYNVIISGLSLYFVN